MGFLTKEQLLTKTEVDIEKVILDEEKDEFVYVKELMANEKEKFDKSCMKIGKNEKGETTYENNLDLLKAKLACATVCDEQGVLVFDIKDAHSLSKNMTAKQLEKIWDAARSLNGMTDESIEDMTKNLESGQSEDSNLD